MYTSIFTSTCLCRKNAKAIGQDFKQKKQNNKNNIIFLAKGSSTNCMESILCMLDLVSATVLCFTYS